MAEFLHDNEEILMRYLDGEMDGAEKEMFESQLQTDSALKQRLESLQVAIASVQQYGTAEKVKAVHAEMMQELSSVHKESKVVPMRRFVKYSLAIAASVIIILVGVNIFTSSQPSSKKLFDEAFVNYDASGVRGNKSQTDIVKLYQNHNYGAVTEKAKAQNLAQKDSLLIGLSFLQQNKLDDAIDWFRAISVQSSTKDDGEFYLALAYLKNKNYDEALKLMEGIHSNVNHVYHNQFSQAYIDKVKKLNSK
jgi:tetratricopeptide (TPR) repeat protein